MKIEDILNLTEGSLQTKPEIHTIEGATTFPSKIEHGDLLFSNSPEDINTAINNGAYAIVYDNIATKITDPEIAWIKVDSIRDSAFRLLRYALLSKEADFQLLGRHEMSFLKMILTHKGNIIFLSSEWNKAFEQILNGKGYLFVSSDESLIKLIKPDSKRLEKEADGYAVNDTLFRSTFRIGKYVYQDIKLVPFHLEYLLKIVEFCDLHQLPYSIDRLHYTQHFMPLPIDNNLASSTLGKSDKVLIFTDEVGDIVKARDYIRYQTTWVKSIVLTPPKTKVENVDRPYWFTHMDEAREILKSVHYNYAFVYSLDKEVFKSFDVDSQQKVLF